MLIMQCREVNDQSHCAVAGKWTTMLRCPSCILCVIYSCTAQTGSWHSGSFHSTGISPAQILRLITNLFFCQPVCNLELILTHPQKEVLSIVVSCTCNCLWVLFLLSVWNANSLPQMSRAAHQNHRARMGAVYPAQPGVTRSLTVPMPQMRKAAVSPLACVLHCR